MDYDLNNQARLEELGLYFGEDEPVEDAPTTHNIQTTNTNYQNGYSLGPYIKQEVLYEDPSETQEITCYSNVNYQNFNNHFQPNKFYLSTEIFNNSSATTNLINQIECSYNENSIEDNEETNIWEPVIDINEKILPSGSQDLDSGSGVKKESEPESEFESETSLIEESDIEESLVVLNDFQFEKVKKEVESDSTSDIEAENDNVQDIDVANEEKTTLTPVQPIFDADDFKHIIESRHPSTKKRFYCNLCKVWCLSCRALKIHKYNRHRSGSVPKKTFQCPECQNVFPARNKLTFHLNNIHSKVVVDCKKCQKKFTNPQRLRDHELSVHQQTRLHKCMFCDRKFKHLSTMIKHRYCHSTERPYKCSLCPKSFLNSKLLERHQNVHKSSNNIFECKKCLLILPDLDSLREHRKIHWKEDQMTCHMCNITFKSPALLGRHKVENHSDQTFNCEICSLPFATALALKRHALTHSVEKPNKCTICEKSFRYPRYLKRHLAAAHNGERPYVCKECDKGFVCLDAYYKHKRVHTGRNVTCGLCKRSIKEYSFNRHMKTVHDPNLPAFPCPVCKNIYRSEEMRQKHVQGFHKPRLKKVYISKKKFKCGLCQRRFWSEEEKDRHKVDHLNEDGTRKRPYGCDYCEKRFTTLKLASKHKSIHTMEKKFQCDICSKRFRLKEYVKTHMNLHFGNKKHECDVCGKKFAERNTLKNHRLIHTGERPFQCQLCDKSFARSETLRLHHLSHTKEVPHECQICGKKYRYYSKFRVHLRTHFQQIDSTIIIAD